MKKVKLIVLVLAIGLIALVFFQNLPYLMAQPHLLINLYIPGFQYDFSSITNAVLLAGVFLIGLLIAYFSDHSTGHRI